MARHCRRRHTEPPVQRLGGPSARIQSTSRRASSGLIATLLGGIARPDALPAQWLSYGLEPASTAVVSLPAAPAWPRYLTDGRQSAGAHIARLDLVAGHATAAAGQREHGLVLRLASHRP